MLVFVSITILLLMLVFVSITILLLMLVFVSITILLLMLVFVSITIQFKGSATQSLSFSSQRCYDPELIHY